jgi:anthranilate 1,2-dioxygenase large subunit
MPTFDATGFAQPTNEAWPPGLTRVPYWVFQRRDLYAAEQKRLFQGPCWNYLCLEAEISQSGDYRATYAGDTPVVVARGQDGEIYAFENRCAHRGALLALKSRGNAKDFSCVYHAWTYNLQGDLTGVAFKDGLNGSGGMAKDFCMATHGPRKLRIATAAGLIFGSFADNVPSLEEYIGTEVMERLERVLQNRTLVVIGRFTQMLPNNWKLYVENVKDSYHASILHLFFTTFELNRLSQTGGVIIDESGGHHVSYSAVDKNETQTDVYAEQKIRSQSDYKLADPSLLDGFDEYGDGVTLQILSIFPGFVLQQIQNAIAVRQILPRGVEQTELNWTYLGFENDTPEQRRMRLKQGNLVGAAGYVSMEDGCVGGFVQRGIAGAAESCSILEMGGDSAQSSNSRVTEASVRGFWKAYRSMMEQ